MRHRPLDIKFSRKNTIKPIHIFCRGERVGCITGSLTTPRKFLLRFNGIYFDFDRRINFRGGTAVLWCDTLGEATFEAMTILKRVRVQPYEEPERGPGPLHESNGKA